MIVFFFCNNPIVVKINKKNLKLTWKFKNNKKIQGPQNPRIVLLACREQRENALRTDQVCEVKESERESERGNKQK